MSLTVEYCMLVYSELDDCLIAARKLGPKFKKMQAQDLAHILLTILDEYDGEEFVGAILQVIENMPINFFDTVLDYDKKIAEVYRNI